VRLAEGHYRGNGAGRLSAPDSTSEDGRVPRTWVSGPDRMQLFPTLLVLIAAWLPAHQSRNPDQQPRYQPDWPCVGRPDPSYVHVAEATGGQVFLFHPSELGQSAALAIGNDDAETLFRVVASLDDGIHEYNIPVDATVETVRFSVSLQCLQIVEIARPDGVLLQAADPAVEYDQFQAGRIVSVRQPAPGVWRVRVSGRGLFSLVVQGRSEVSLDAVEFVREAGLPGREGLLPTREPPRAGVPQILRVKVSGPVADVRARLVTSIFEDLQPLSLRALSQDVDEQEWLADITLRPGAFRVVVTGRDERGYLVQRVHAPLLEATR
jgi:von Willebrand factor A domain-containing protein 7